MRAVMDKRSSRGHPPVAVPRRDRTSSVMIDAENLHFLRTVAVHHANRFGGRPSVSAVVQSLIIDSKPTLIKRYGL